MALLRIGRPAARLLIAGAGCALLAAVVVAAPSAAAPVPEPRWATPAELENFVRTRYSELALPGLAVIVLAEGKVLFEGVYGEAAPGRQVTLDTPFRLGSTSKQYTGLAIQQLVGAGELALDTPVAAVLPEFGSAPGWSQTTVADLLSHRSGISTRAGLDFFGPFPATHTLTAEAQRLAGLPLAHPAGQVHEYSNANYSLLGAIIERVTGLAYPAALRDLVTGPLGLAATSADPLAGPADGVAAEFYPWLGAWNVPTPAPPPGEVGVPSAYVASSARDLATVLQAHLATAPGLPPEVLAASREPLGAVDEYSGYASGWVVRSFWELSDFDQGWDDPDRPRLWEHHGDTQRSQSYLSLSPEYGLGVVALTNTGPGTDRDRWPTFMYQLHHAVLGTIGNPPRPDPLVAVAPALMVALPLLQVLTLGWLASGNLRRRPRPWVPLALGGALAALSVWFAVVVLPERTGQALVDTIWMVAVPDLAIAVALILLGAAGYLALATTRLLSRRGTS